MTDRLLDVKALRGGYGPINVLHGIDFHVNTGEVVVILGANGAGKTTTLRAVSGMIETTGQRRAGVASSCWARGPRTSFGSA